MKLKSKPIKFSHPKYVIPLIALPFLFIFFYVFKSFAKGTEGSPALTENRNATPDSSGLNSTIQDPSDEIASSVLADKFDASSRKYKDQTDFTAIQSLGPDAGNYPDTAESLYSDQEKRTIDSLRESILKRQRKFLTSSPSDTEAISGSDPGLPVENSYTREEDLQKTINQLKKHQSSGSSSYNYNDMNNYMPPAGNDDRMDLFRAQMEYIDSLERERNPEYKKEKKTKPKKELPKPLSVKKVNGPDLTHFNTVTPAKTDIAIKAIIDEDLKAIPGSRIRIRLLDDILVKDNVIAKGTYLFGVVSGFQTQRVNITITSVMVDDEILPVELNVYDKDAMLGLYVPGSNFREFTKDLGSGSIEGIPNTGDGENLKSEVVSGVVTRMFQSTTTAATSLIKKDKAKLKYNTIVYLIPKKD